MLEEFHSIQVLIAAVQIGDPFSRLLPIVKIEHPGKVIHTDTVHMIHLRPEQSVGDQIVLHLGTGVIEDISSVRRKQRLSGVPVLIEIRAVESAQPVQIP